MSLEGWQSAGILERELALYRALLPRLEHLSFVTYGDSKDVELGREVIPQAEILTNRRHWSPNLYSLLAPWTHRRTLRQATVFKTNQLNGGWSAVLANHLFRKRLVVRCGFLWSQSALDSTTSWLRRAVVTGLERWVLRSADRIILAAAAHRRVVESDYGVSSARVSVIPNYVDTGRFRRLADVPVEPGRVTYVGRLSVEKNPMSLLEAVVGLDDVTVVFAGDGPLRPSLEAFARERQLRVEFLGTVPHGQLPKELNRSAAFVMPSHYEGNPKALLEAMACGVPVIGTRVRGIEDVIVDVLGDAELRAGVSARAQAYVRTSCSLEHVVAAEWAVLAAASEERTHV